MDDEYTQPHMRGDGVPEGSTQAAVAEKWSCIDYVDTPRSAEMKATKPRYAEKPESGGLSVRFGEITGHDTRQENHEGACRKKGAQAWAPEKACDDARALMLYDTVAEAERKWWTGKQTNRGWPGTAEGKINTAQGMAGDLVSNLDSEEKSAVAGILTRTVSGGEVVEVTAVTTTSVMANVCYDLEHPVAVPFGCVGFGTNIISVADGHVDAKLAYRIQGGLSYNVTPRVTAFVSGYYHKVLGEGEYDDIPVERLRDDQSPEGRSKNYALARFKMAYVGAEMGVRFAF